MRAVAANHTATHLLDYCLKQVLGDHVEQKGSYVDKDTLRLDSLFQKVTDEELRRGRAQGERDDTCRLSSGRHREPPIRRLRNWVPSPSFGEKYGDKVHCGSLGPSAEFCGVVFMPKSTGKIGFFKIISEEEQRWQPASAVSRL